MTRLLEHPTTCPHGNPIPGTDYHAPNTVTLDQLDVGSAASWSPASPRSWSSPPGCSSSSRTSSVLPGHQGTVTAASPDGTTTVEIDGRHVGIGSFASTRILVTAG